MAVLSSALTSLPLQLSHFCSTHLFGWPEIKGKALVDVSGLWIMAPVLERGQLWLGWHWRPCILVFWTLGVGFLLPSWLKKEACFLSQKKLHFFGCIFYDEILLCSHVIINTRTHIMPSLTVLAGKNFIKVLIILHNRKGTTMVSSNIGYVILGNWGTLWSSFYVL